MPEIMVYGIQLDAQTTFTVKNCITFDASKPPTQAYLDWCRATRPDSDWSELAWAVWIGRLDA